MKSGTERASARTAKTRLMTLLPPPNGSYRKGALHAVVLPSAAALMPASSSAPRSLNAPTCSALPSASGPLLDMTRYHLFDFAAGWAEEYGSPEDERDFHSLLGYSPYHRVQDGADYPAVLLISGDADTRCNPMHARKMAARLRQQIAQNIRSCSITNQTGATRRFSLCRPRSTLSPTDSPSSVTNSEFMSGTGGFRDAVYSRVVDTICL